MEDRKTLRDVFPEVESNEKLSPFADFGVSKEYGADIKWPRKEEQDDVFYWVIIPGKGVAAVGKGLSGRLYTISRRSKLLTPFVTRYKYVSRAHRCATACSDIGSAVDELNSLSFEEGEDIDSLNSVVSDAAENARKGLEELGALKEELESWRDNISGTNFETSEKFEQLEEAISQLDSAISSIEYAVSQIEDAEITIDNAEEKVDELSGYAGDLESGISDAESVEFPGMY